MIDETIERAVLEDGFWVATYRIEPQLQRISKDGYMAQVEPKVMEVLLCLAEQAGKTVSKEQFMQRVWGDTVVTEDALLRCISELRKRFGDDTKASRYIETIRKRGYRLIAPVSVHPPPPAGTGCAAPEAADGFPASAADTPSVQPPHAAPAIFRQRPATYRVWMAAAVFAVLLAGNILLASRGRPHEAPLPLKATPLTSYVGEESDPSLSPDGNQVAFSWDQGNGGSPHIYVQQVGTATPLQITDGPYDEHSPAWSPDGSRIAFVRAGEGEDSIYLKPILGGSERSVAVLGAREIRELAWSPDGTMLAFSAQQAAGESFGLFLLSVETLSTRPLTQPPPGSLGDFQPAFSPDGRTLAFVRSVAENVDDIFVLPVAGGQPTRVTSDHAEITGLSWTADGKELVFTSDREGAFTLWRVSAVGGAPQWIATSGEGSGVHQPAVARRGGRMAFVQRFRELNIWQFRPDDPEAEPHRVISSTRWDSNPDVSPDGKRIAFASNRSGTYEIWTSDRDGANPVQLTQFGGPFTGTPRWSPDGSQIAFAARENESVDIYVMDASGGKPHRLTTTKSNDRAPNWSQDGRWIYFASNRSGSWQTWKVAAEGGEAVQLTRDGGYNAQEAPDGETLFYVRRDQRGLWRMPAAGGSGTLVLDALAPYDWGNWLVREAGIYFIRRGSGRPVLAFYDFDTEEVRPLAELAQVPRHPSLSASADGKLILFTRIDRSESDLLLVEDFR